MVTPESNNTNTGFHWGKRIAIVYVTFALATLSFVAFAMNRSVDLVRGDYYEASLDYNKTAIALANAKKLGVTATIVRTQENNVVITIPHQHVSNGVVNCYRPDNPSLDKQVPLLPVNGCFTLPSGLLTNGKWKIQVSWVHDGSHYLLEQPIYLWNS